MFYLPQHNNRAIADKRKCNTVEGYQTEYTHQSWSPDLVVWGLYV